METILIPVPMKVDATWILYVAMLSIERCSNQCVIPTKGLTCDSIDLITMVEEANMSPIVAQLVWYCESNRDGGGWESTLANEIEMAYVRNGSSTMTLVILWMMQGRPKYKELIQDLGKVKF